MTLIARMAFIDDFDASSALDGSLRIYAAYVLSPLAQIPKPKYDAKSIFRARVIDLLRDVRWAMMSRC